MTREEHLAFCKICIHRKPDLKQGLLCGLTGEKADFEGECPQFEHDETVGTEPAGPPPKHDTLDEVVQDVNITPEMLEVLKVHQRFRFAVFGGILAMLLGSVIWAVITVATEYQIGFMAVGVGLLVGFAIRFFGAGIDKKFGFLGAGLSLLGCILGNLFSQIGFIAEGEGLGYYETLTYMDLSLVFQIMVSSFDVMDVLFYGIAVYEGYRFAFRRITVQTLARMEEGISDGTPSMNRLRMPLAIICVLLLSGTGLILRRGVNGPVSWTYESGKPMAEGEMEHSKLSGSWTYWYEAGGIECKANYREGVRDGLWIWYGEEGQVTLRGGYEFGLEQGVWQSYYENGQMSDSGSYHSGRKNGEWKYWYENGVLASMGSLEQEFPVGVWNTYHENGSLANVMFYQSEDSIFLQESWSEDGEAYVLNGDGVDKEYHSNGQLSTSGSYRKGLPVGEWEYFHMNGVKKEEVSFTNGDRTIQNSWDAEGNPMVVNGTGIYKSFSMEGGIIEEGEIKNGLKEGVWKTYFPNTGTLMIETAYVEGANTGSYTAYYESGTKEVEGMLEDGKNTGEWKWFHENGVLSSKVHFENGKKEGKQLRWNDEGVLLKEEHYKQGILEDS